jgi:hypothetical protein
MKSAVREFVRSWHVCQQAKHECILPPELLHPLPIPSLGNGYNGLHRSMACPSPSSLIAPWWLLTNSQSTHILFPSHTHTLLLKLKIYSSILFIAFTVYASVPWSQTMILFLLASSGSVCSKPLEHNCDWALRITPKLTGILVWHRLMLLLLVTFRIDWMSDN